MRYLGVLVAGLVAFAFASQADVVTIEQIICKLNGDIVTNVDLEHDRADLEKQLRANGYSGQRLEDALKQQTPNLLRDKIDHLLLQQKGKELELKVDPRRQQVSCRPPAPDQHRRSGKIPSTGARGNRKNL